jgi:hypothetical protein
MEYGKHHTADVMENERYRNDSKNAKEEMYYTFNE